MGFVTVDGDVRVVSNVALNFAKNGWSNGSLVVALLAVVVGRRVIVVEVKR